ncbi:MAG TPA: hypothetical protein VIZ60_07885, partial [Rubrobacter sp.]
PGKERNVAVSKTIPASAAMASEESVLWLAQGSEGRKIPLRSEDARAGKRVMVREDHRTASLRGQEGTIVKRWGTPATPPSMSCSMRAIGNCSGTTSWTYTDATEPPSTR